MTTTLATTAPLDLGMHYEVRDGLVIDQRCFSDENGEAINADGNIWHFMGREYIQRGGNLFPNSAPFTGSVSLATLKLWSTMKTAGPAPKGRIVASLPGHYADWSIVGPQLGFIRANMGMPVWYLAEASDLSEELIEAYESGEVQLEDAVQREVFAVLLEHEHGRQWEVSEGTVFPPDPFLDEGDEGEPYCTLHPLDRGLTRRVNALCREAGMDVSDLADAAGVDSSDLYFLLSGESTWTVGELYLVSQALGVTPTELTRQAEIIADEEGK